MFKLRRSARLVPDLDDEVFGGDLSNTRFGAAPGPSAAPRPGAGYVDNRLRGLNPSNVGVQGTNAANAGYDAASRRYAVISGDPLAQAVHNEQQRGRRVPAQYQTPSAQAGLPSISGRAPADDRIYTDMHPDGSAWNSSAVAGQRQTHWGTQGARTDTSGGPWWPARKRFGYGQAKYRDAGYSQEFDTEQQLERRAGRLTTPTTFDQEVDSSYPYLHLRAGGTSVQPEGTYFGNALMKVTVGNFGVEGGAEDIREFWVGGGLVAVFDLKGWNNVRIQVEELLAGTFVEFAWTTEGLPGDNATLLLPQSYVSDGLVQPVPSGAYAVSIENPIPGVPGTTVQLEWIGRLGGAVFNFTQEVSDNSPVAGPRPYVYFGEPIPVLAPSFRIDANVDLVWWLRAI